jgi:hypothetical protein
MAKVVDGAAPMPDRLTVILPPVLTDEEKVQAALKKYGGSLTAGDYRLGDGYIWGDGHGDGWGDGSSWGEGDSLGDGCGSGWGDGDDYGEGDGDGDSRTDA